MADVAMGNLRFDLTADNTQFMAAVKQAKEAQTQAASEMGSKFGEAASKAQAALQKMSENLGQKTLDTIRKLQELGKAAGEVWSKGAEGAEEATNKLVNAVSNKLSGALYDLTGKIPVVGKFVQGISDLVVSSGAWDTIRQKVIAQGALWADGLLEKFKAPTWGDSIKSTIAATAASTNSLLGQFFDSGTLDEQQKNVDTFANNVAKKMNEMVQGVRDALQKLAGVWDGVPSDMKKAIEGLKERTENQRFQTSLLGMDAGQRSAAIEKRRILQETGKDYDELNEKTKKLFETELGNNEDAANDKEARQKALEQTRQREQAVRSLSAALERQGQLALANARGTDGKSAFDRAMERSKATADGFGGGRVTGLAEDPVIAYKRLHEAQREQFAANEKYRSDADRMLEESGRRGQMDIANLGATPGEAERRRVEMDLENKAKREGIVLDDQRIAQNQAIAASMGMIAQATAEARERYEALREVGRSVASALEDAFGRMISGTKFQWKDFIVEMQKDLARLAFKKGVEGALLGSTAGGGGLIGAIAGAFTGQQVMAPTASAGGWVTSAQTAGMFGGFRADGGPVGAGNAYIVGERGPEMFVPQSAGSIVPNHAMGGGGNASVINMRIDLKGANGDETIARISAQAARQAAMAAVRQSNEGFPERQRTLSLLGS